MSDLNELGFVPKSCRLEGLFVCEFIHNTIVDTSWFRHNSMTKNT